jgi:hypothetical protein
MHRAQRIRHAHRARAIVALLALAGAACTARDDTRAGTGDSARAPAGSASPRPTPSGASTGAAAGATTGAADAASDTSTWTLGPDGGHGLRIGMTAAAARQVIGAPATSALGPNSCEVVGVPGRPGGVFVMFVNDSLVRIDVRNQNAMTTEGTRVGDTEARVRALYPAVKSTPHKYTGPAGHYLTVTPGDTSRRIVFETDGQRVTVWRVGKRPAVEFVEGCA